LGIITAQAVAYSAQGSNLNITNFSCQKRENAGNEALLFQKKVAIFVSIICHIGKRPADIIENLLLILLNHGLAKKWNAFRNNFKVWSWPSSTQIR
jgi:hypothetical protein